MMQPANRPRTRRRPRPRKRVFAYRVMNDDELSSGPGSDVWRD